METPPRKRGRPPKHRKVDSPSAVLPPSHTNLSPLNRSSSPADVEMVDRVVLPVDSRSGPRGRKKSSSLVDKLDAPASVKPGAGSGAGGSPSTRDLSKSEADDVDSPVERLSSRRSKKSSSVQCLFPCQFPFHALRAWLLRRSAFFVPSSCIHFWVEIGRRLSNEMVSSFLSLFALLLGNAAK